MNYKIIEILIALLIIYFMISGFIFSFNHPNLNQHQVFKHPIEFLLWKKIK